METSRPATLADLKKLIVALNENDAKYFLVGGYALAIHGYSRTTIDVDILVPADSENGRKIIQALLVLEDQSALDIDPLWFDEGENFALGDEIYVDILMNACGHAYEDLLPYAEIVDVDGVEISTVSLEGLLKTKQGMRDQDKADRLVIERSLNRFKFGLK